MNRRQFLFSFTTIALVIPFYKFKQESVKEESFLDPHILSFVDIEQIKMIGEDYVKQFPLEHTAENLQTLITESYPQSPFLLEKKAFTKFISLKIKNDFINGNIIICNGWILSKTEARQCALFSLN